MPTGTVLTRRGVGGLCVLCLSGRLWFTETGLAVDRILRSGEPCVVGGTGLGVVEALCDSALVQIGTMVGPASLPGS